MDGKQVQALARFLSVDRVLPAGTSFEVQRCDERSLGSRATWAIVLVDLTTGDELKVGSAVAFGSLTVRRPWTYRATAAGLRIVPAEAPREL
ncbi:hypothetical protein [Litorihabitans aurantiacus]|uniref:Uncharacterized protein n=1 Tax=Litorihabitans aurantiacus TaxID=1930061 RepID=A0AA37XH79_9MICO|nr:hypothetical protein [Litorihabitans aurantiacus]GMA32872.1 hypothetical protein GCM10025875_28640 [Litorihabitans aurantiacus]